MGLEQETEDALTHSKKLLTSNKLLEHFNPELKLILECDALADGLWAVLFHEMKDKVCKPTAFGSSTLADADKSYF